MSSKDNLENLVRSGGLVKEPPDRKEYEGYMDAADPFLTDLLAATDELMAQVRKAIADAESMQK